MAADRVLDKDTHKLDTEAVDKYKVCIHILSFTQKYPEMKHT